MQQLSDHAKGMLFTVAGVLVVTPDSLLLRLISADLFTLMFWRGLAVCLTLAAGLALLHKARVLALFTAIGRPGLIFAVLFTANSFSFVIAVHNTTVTNTLVLISAAPFFAAVIARLFLGEAVRPRTWIAILAAFVGILTIVSESLLSGPTDPAPSGTSLLERGARLGDLAALATALGLAVQFNLIRRYRHINMLPGIALGNLFSALVSLPLAATLTVVPMDILWIGLLSVIVLPLGTVLIVTGPRYLPAPEVGLILLLEAVVGPFWVWLALGELPSQRAVIGGTIIIAALAGHSLAALRQVREARSSP